MAGGSGHDFSAWIVVATTVFLIWALLFAGLRTWAKAKRSLKWALYDNFFTAAFIISIGECACVYLAVHHGFGRPQDSSAQDEQDMKKAAYASQILYILSIGVSKISTILFLRELARDPLQKRISLGVTIIVSCWTVGSVFAVALRGRLSMPWQTLYDHRNLYITWLGVECSGLGLELVMWGVSVMLTWNLNMSFTKRLRVISIFGFRFFLLPIVVLRLYFLSRARTVSSLDALAIAQVFTQGAMQYSLMAECMTCLKPFLAPFHSNYQYSIADETSNPKRGLEPIFNNPRRDAYTSVTSDTSGRHSASRPAERALLETRMPDRSVSQRLGLDPNDHEEEEMPHQGDSVSCSAKASRAESRPHIASAASHRRLDRAIHQTTTVSVVSDEEP